MPYDNNRFTSDTDGQHLERARILEDGIVAHGPGLGFDAAQIAIFAGYRTVFEDALSDADKEDADVQEVYAELDELEKQARAKYMNCHNYVLGEMVFAETGTIAWLEEAFDTVDEMPARRGDFVKVAGFALERYNNIALEHPDVALDATLFGDLQTLIDSLILKEKSIPLERGQWREAVAEKNAVRATGEKYYRWIFRRAISHWGDDDSKLLELGMVPNSLIGTPQGEPEPGGDETPWGMVQGLEAFIDPIGNILINWKKVAGAVTYKVLRSVVLTGDPEPPFPYPVYKTGIYMGSYTDTDHDPGKTYYYSVVAVNAAAEETEPCAGVGVVFG